VEVKEVYWVVISIYCGDCDCVIDFIRARASRG